MSNESLRRALAWWLAMMRGKGVTFEVCDGELVVDGPAAELTEGRLRDLRELKAEAIEILKGSQ